MALTTAQIQNAYVAFFNRPADVAGLQYWSTYAGNAADLLNTFAQSAEYKSLYANMNSTQIVNAVYQNLFGRAPEVAGLNYWVGKLDNGQLTIGNVADAINQGAQGSDKTIITNKTEAATAFTAALDTTAEILAYAGVNSTGLQAVKTWLNTLNDSTKTVASVTGTDLTTVLTTVQANVASSGSTFTLTTGVDALAGTSGNDTFKGVMNTNIAAGATFNAGDEINGGAGTDTLNLTIADMDAPAVVTLAGVEKVVATVADAAAGAVPALSAATWTGVTHVGVASTITTSATANALTLSNLQNNVTLTLENITVGTDDDLVIDATFGSGKVGSTTATLAIDTNGVGSKTKDAEIKVTTAGTDKFTAMSVNATGANYITLTEGTAATSDLDSLTVTGAGSVKITDSGTELDGIKTITASANTGGVTVDISANVTENISVTGGSGNDNLTVALTKDLTIDAGAGDDVVTLGGTISTDTLTSADSIKGGDGSADVLAIDDASWDALDGDTSTDRAVISGFERARVTDALATEIDVSKFAGINYVQLTTATASDAAKISGVTSGATVEVIQSANNTDWTEEVEVNMTGATGSGTESDELNIKLNADILAADANLDVSFAIDGINIVNVVTADQDNADGLTDRTEGYNLDFEANKASNLKTLNVSGDRALHFVADGTDDALATVAAANLSGNLTVNLAAFDGTQGIVVTGGSGANTVYGTGLADKITGGARADVLQGAAGNDEISGGDGDDFIDGGAGADTMTGGAGADTFTVNAVALGSGTTVDKITDFAAGTDFINYGAAFAGTIVEVTSNLNDKATLADAATTAGSTIGAGNAGTFTYNSKTYMLIDANATTGFTDGTDIVVEVTGMTGTLKAASYVTTGATINGTDRADTLVGTAGADTVRGFGGNDSITVSAGNDTIKFEATAAANGQDSIKDFLVAGTDKLDFTAFLGGAASVNTTAFDITGTTGSVTGATNVAVAFNKAGGTLASGDFQGTTGSNKIAIEDNSKAVILVTADADGTSDTTVNAYNIYYVEDTDTATGSQTWAVTLVGTLDNTTELGAAAVAAAAAYV